MEHIYTYIYVFFSFSIEMVSNWLMTLASWEAELLTRPLNFKMIIIQNINPGGFSAPMTNLGRTARTVEICKADVIMRCISLALSPLVTDRRYIRIILATFITKHGSCFCYFLFSLQLIFSIYLEMSEQFLEFLFSDLPVVWRWTSPLSLKPFRKGLELAQFRSHSSSPPQALPVVVLCIIAERFIFI